MKLEFHRRQVLSALAATGVSACATLTGGRSAAGPHPRIGVSSNSFRTMFTNGSLDMFRYPAFVKSQLNLTNLELINGGFAAQDDAYCRRIGQTARDEGCRIINVLHTDQTVLPIDPDPAVRQKSIDTLKRWMDMCAIIGSPSFRSNSSFKRPGEEPNALERIVAMYKELAAYGQSVGVKLLVENHVGFQAVIDNAIAIIKGVNSPNCRGIVDWGNSPATDDAGRVADIQRMMPYVDLVSAKGVDFDENNRHISFDQAALVRAAEAGGYRGLYSVDLFANPEPKDPVGAARTMVATIQDNLRTS
jgi:sugar phosphate isomerase/epimerase